MRYLLRILKNNDVLFEERQGLGHSILTKYLNFKDESEHRKFVLYTMFICDALFVKGHSSYPIMMSNLLKEGKINKSVTHLIVRRLIKENVDIAPALFKVIKN